MGKTVNQCVFLEGRLLLENVLLATELVKDYHKPLVSTRAAVKLDISKAFGTVSWSFIEDTLCAMKFEMRSLNRICMGIYQGVWRKPIKFFVLSKRKRCRTHIPLLSKQLQMPENTGIISPVLRNNFTIKSRGFSGWGLGTETRVSFTESLIVEMRGILLGRLLQQMAGSSHRSMI